MRVLDLDCGSTGDLAHWDVTDADKVTGLDIDHNSLTTAHLRFPDRTFLQGAGECLPFEAESFDRVISNVALPYMNIEKVLAEIHRILVPGGGLSVSLHAPSFTIAELLHNAIPRPVPTLFRLYVFANGVVFYFSGKTMGFVNGRTESFQSERGMRLALKHAGFDTFSFRRGTGPAGETFIAEVRKSGVTDCFTAAQGNSLRAEEVRPSYSKTA